MEKKTEEGNKDFVLARYPDAHARKYAALSIVIWSNVLDCRLSGFFLTEEKAWESAVEWITRIKNHSEQISQIKKR